MLLSLLFGIPVVSSCPPAWRQFDPLEAANGILMFGVSTAVMSAAVNDVFKRNFAKLQNS